MANQNPDFSQAGSKQYQKKNSRSKGKKGRKYGRNRAKCEKYRREGRREINKKRRIAKDLKRSNSNK